MMKDVTDTMPTEERQRMTPTPTPAANAAELNHNIGLAANHFELLRIAKLRGLKVRQLGERMYAVASFTRSNIEWVVTADACTCPAKGYCTHRSAATNFYFMNDAPAGDFTEYRCQDVADCLQLRLRIRSGETTRNYRTYLRYCVKVYARKLAAAKPDIGIRRVESTRNRRKVVREFCGAIQI